MFKGLHPGLRLVINPLLARRATLPSLFAPAAIAMTVTLKVLVHCCLRFPVSQKALSRSIARLASLGMDTNAVVFRSVLPGI